MTKVIEIFFRNKWKLIALLLVPVLLSGVIIYLLPRSYQATARLYALQRYTIIGATGPESDLQSTPAMTQATALNEFLQTRSFDLAVAADTDLAKHIGVSTSDVPQLQDALYTELSTHVTVTPDSANLFVITYANHDPQIAMQVVKAVVAHFGDLSASHATAEGKQLLANYQSQLQAAQTDANNATQAAAQYLRDHNLTVATAQADPQYQLLSSQAERARATLSGIQNNINNIQDQISQLSSGAQGLYLVIDAPTVPTRPESRTKSLMLGGGVGVTIGILACIGYLLVLVRLDQSIYSLADLPAITDYPVLVQIPRLPRRSATWITRTDEKLLSDKGA